MNPFNYLKYGNRKIYQFSPVRTGSTLVYNILKEIFPRHQIVKSHKLNTQVADNAPVVVTYRHPLDSLASTFQALDLVLTEEELEVQVKRHKERGLDDLFILWNHPNVLKLKYEAFYNDFGVIFNGIEQFFDLKIQDKKNPQSLKNTKSAS